jgi:Spy/CpxP family protein refolding chaperone
MGNGRYALFDASICVPPFLAGDSEEASRINHSVSAPLSVEFSADSRAVRRPEKKGPNMSLLDSVSGLMKSAKSLRAIAENLGDVELKSQIVDEMLQLQEIREQLTATAPTNGDVAAISAPPDREQKDKALSFDDKEKFAQFEPSADGETYGLHADAERMGSKPGAAVDAPESAVISSAKTDADIPVDAANSSPSPTESQYTNLSEEDRFRLAEKNIRELEPLNLAALNKMNEILTDEQKKKKAAATKAGIRANKKGRELQQAVMAAIGLDDDQKERMAAARAELQRIRTAISKQVEGLLTPEQTAQLLKDLSKDKKKGV